jgi:hypothetical protein
MLRSRLLAAFGVTVICLAAGSSAFADSGGNAATLRAAAGRLVAAELAGNGAGVCAVLNTPLTATVAGRTCAERWDARSGAMRSSAAGRLALRRDLRAVATAPVRIDGEHGSIALPEPLLDGHSRFYWTANCWMLTG